MILSIDYGLKRIGLAVTDLEGIGIKVLPILKIESESDALRKFEKIVKDNLITTLLFGLPLNADGEKTQWTEQVIDFAEKLSKEYKLELKYINEFYSSKFARSGGLHVEYGTRKKIDSIVAKHLLLSYFESKRNQSK